MSFFKDFKQDLSQAVNELMPDETAAVEEAFAAPETSASSPFADPMIDTQAISDIMDTEATFNSDELADMLKNIDDVKMDIPEPTIEPMPQMAVPTPAPAPEPEPAPEPAPSPIPDIAVSPEPVYTAPAPEPVAEPAFTAPAPEPAPAPAVSTVEPVFAPDPVIPDDQRMTAAPIFGEPDTVKSEPINTVKNLKTMAIGVIIKGMQVNGDVKAEGSLDVQGIVRGNIEIEGRLEITGAVEGNSFAEEVFADGAKVVGDIKCNGSVKIGPSSVVRGNLTATAAVIAGAVKGDIDIQGPVILDSTAIIMGNIKSKSIQINNGATIEGLCSQCYGDVSPLSFFGEDKPADKPAAKTAKK